MVLVVREGLTEKVAFKQRLECTLKGSAKALRQECAWQGSAVFSRDAGVARERVRWR